MVNFIVSIFDFWQGVMEGIREGFGNYYNQSDLFTSKLQLWGIDTCISDILLLGLSIATFGFLVFFAFKAIQFAFRMVYSWFSFN